MADGGNAAPVAETSGRSDRAPLVAFIGDAETERALRDGLAEYAPTGFDVRRGNVRTAIAALSKMPTPRTLLIDVTGDPQPLAALADLSQVVEPDVKVLIIGDREGMDFYRQVTRSLGAHEYLYKPLVAEMVARHFGPHILQDSAPVQSVRGGRVIAVTGTRGGAGATTVAVNLAWFLASDTRRYTVLLDADLHTGTAAMLLGAKSGPGLRTALEAPQRVDELFLDRSAIPVQPRLDILACEEKLTDQPEARPGAASRLLETLRRRYNCVIADVRFAPLVANRDLLDLVHQRVLVLPPTLAGARDALRLLALPQGSSQARKPVLVLNRTGAPGALSRKQLEDTLGLPIEIAIPDLPHLVLNSETVGEPAAKRPGKFRAGIAALAAQLALAAPTEKAKPSLLRWRR